MKKQFTLTILFNFTCFLFLTASSVIFAQNLTLHPLFTDHTVLQQKTKAAIWGMAEPQAEITVSASWGKSAKTRADENGEWKAEIKTPKAGGPFQITLATNSEKIQLNDILIGEVWLCSGQSNMEMPVRGWPPNDLIENSAEEIKNADNNQLRMFTVQHAINRHQQKTIVGDWAVCSPQTAGNFSATAFFFGRKLQQTLGIPVGLIHSSWGGTPAESWTAESYIKKLNDYKDISSILDSAQFEHERLQKWLGEKQAIKVDPSKGDERWKNLEFGGAALATTNYDDANWPESEIPQFWESTEVGNFDGVVWYRKHFTLPDDWHDKDLVLELCAIDDMDRAYLNGQLVGSTELMDLWRVKRTYNVPAGVARAGENVISVRVVDVGGGGGMHGEAADLRIYPAELPENALSLAGTWRYLPTVFYESGVFQPFGTTVADYKAKPTVKMRFNSHTPTVLYNAMIAPLVPYAIKGAIWYQGESNVGRAEQYKKLFPTMIQSWRDAWDESFPFYFVQIAPYRYSGPENTESADLRFAQHQTLHFPKTGEAVTLDIGNVDNIHPGKKKDVGERLARWALAKDYGQKKTPYSGPVCKNAKQKIDRLNSASTSAQKSS